MSGNKRNLEDKTEPQAKKRKITSNNTDEKENSQPNVDNQSKKKLDTKPKLIVPDLPFIIVFITGNAGKLKETKAGLGDKIGKYLINYKIDLDEIQDSPEAIAKKKLNEGIKQINSILNDIITDDKARKYKKPLISILVEDTSLSLNKLSNDKCSFPGPFIKFWLKGSNCGTLYDVLNANGGTDFGAKALCCFGYKELNSDAKIIKGEVDGKIVKPKGKNGFGWDPVFCRNDKNDNNLTFAEMDLDTKNILSHRSIAVEKLKEYLANKVSNIEKHANQYI